MVNEEENLSDSTAAVMEEKEEEKVSTPQIPSKSRSLRTTSVRKRLEIEVKMAQPKTKGRMSKKARLSKYRRKSANAKERERMKRMNEEYERLKKVVPMEQLNSEDGKDKKVIVILFAKQNQHLKCTIKPRNV